MFKFNLGDRVAIHGTYDGEDGTGCVTISTLGRRLQVRPEDVWPRREADGSDEDPSAVRLVASAARGAVVLQPTELQSAIAEIGRVTGLSGDDLLHAAAVALQQVASNVVRAAAPYAAARTKAMNDLEWLIGSLGPKVLDHAASPDACGLKGR